jgi:hypothetical protein
LNSIVATRRDLYLATFAGLERPAYIHLAATRPGFD